jgi:hypothetical protein
MDLLMEKARKKNYPLLSVGISPGRLSYDQKQYRMQFRRWLFKNILKKSI